MDDQKQPKSLRKKPFFRFDPVSSVILLVAVFFASQFAALLIVGLYPALQNWTESEATSWLRTVQGRFFYVVAVEILAVIFTLQLIKLAGVARQKIGLVRPRLKDIGWAFASYGLYFLVFLAIVTVAKMLIPALDLEQEQQIGFESARSNIELMMTFLALVVFVPIAEEVMFRGFLFSSLRAKYKFWPSVIVTGIIFGIIHLQFGSGAPLLWVAAIDTFILSCFLCFLRENMKSLWPPIFLHAIKNSTAFILLFGYRFFI